MRSNIARQESQIVAYCTERQAACAQFTNENELCVSIIFQKRNGNWKVNKMHTYCETTNRELRQEKHIFSGIHFSQPLNGIRFTRNIYILTKPNGHAFSLHVQLRCTFAWKHTFQWSSMKNNWFVRVFAPYPKYNNINIIVVIAYALFLTTQRSLICTKKIIAISSAITSHAFFSPTKLNYLFGMCLGIQ